LMTRHFSGQRIGCRSRGWQKRTDFTDIAKKLSNKF
jgi:hypothetical protein